jgi:hypothetical protein
VKPKSVFFVSCVAAALLGMVGIMATQGAGAMTQRPSSNKSPAKKDSCFYSDQISSFATDRDRTLIITTYDNQAYALELGAGCFNVDSALSIAVVPRHGASRICGAFDAEVHYSDAGRAQSCPITAIRHLEGEAAAPYVRAPKVPKPEIKK